jgi:hypothetical protein
MAKQTILFTVMPRGLSLNPAALPVSVYISPRLSDEDFLGAYPDWLNWTARLKENGLALTFESAGNTLTIKSDPAPLRPELWQAMFHEDTYVKSYQFPNYTGRTIVSYPVRQALSGLKNIYQQAGVALALPDPTRPQRKEEDYYPGRAFVRQLLDGLAVNWDERTAPELRKRYQTIFNRMKDQPLRPVYQVDQLNPDGTLKGLPQAGQPGSKGYLQNVALPFAVFHHMPPGQPIEKKPPDFKKLIDFHQALSSLSSYPALLRALGLVLDFDLPADFLPFTSPGGYGSLAIVAVEGLDWKIPTETVPQLKALETAYLYLNTGGGSLFSAAPGWLAGKTEILEAFGLLNLDPALYGLAQLDVDGGLTKTILLAESWGADRRHMEPPDHPGVFDPTITLPSLRSGGISLFADGRALRLDKVLQKNKNFNQALQSNQAQKDPFFAEDLLQGYRLDIWDSHSNRWHSLHRRNGKYTIEGKQFLTTDEEGFTQLAAGQAAPDTANPPPKDLYLHEALARWAGWSLSVPMPGKSLSSDPDPDKALKDDPQHPANEPATPFKMSTEFSSVAGSLPGLRFGRRYRLRVRPVDLAGNSLKFDDPLADLLAAIGMAIPRDPNGLPYLRFEPVAAPLVAPRQVEALTDPGSGLDRLVIRTWNDDPSKDNDPADLSASDRHILPPSTSVEMGERLGMFDDPSGKLNPAPGMWQLIKDRDKGELTHVDIQVAGQQKRVPLEAAARLDSLPYLPDVLARGAALRDLPGSPPAARGEVAPGAQPPEDLPYQSLDDPNPRPGSAALVSFGGQDDWQKLLPFRLALADGDAPPHWDPKERVLTVALPKGSQHIVPLSSYLPNADLPLMGVWAWLREFIDLLSPRFPQVDVLEPGFPIDRLAHILQRAVEGGHWMLTPPRLLTLVHAVQQPLGMPTFTSLIVQRQPYGAEIRKDVYDERLDPDPNVLQTQPEDAPTAATELAPLSAWRKPGSLEAYLLGGLKVHAASTDKVDLFAEWTDPLDDPLKPRELTKETAGEYRQSFSVQVDQVPIPILEEDYLSVEDGPDSYRMVGYYDPDHDLVCFVRRYDILGSLPSGATIYRDAAPRHQFNDARHHRVQYTAQAASRFREYFPQDQDLDFTRRSAPETVEVPASARPIAPQVAYVIPTFGWQRQSETNLVRSVRFGGGLRVYLERPWFSSGDDEHLAVVLYDYSNGFTLDREAWKPYVTQWGGDPIWISQGLDALPELGNFPDAAAIEAGLSLPGGAPGRVRVAAFPVHFDYDSQKWFADLTIDAEKLAYTPFVRLVLARYQPYAVPDAKLSASVLADYIQLTPERSAILTGDPYSPGRLRLTVTGVAPGGPAPQISGQQPKQKVNQPTQIEVSVQQRDPQLDSDLGWQDAPAGTAQIQYQPFAGMPALVRWTGQVTFAKPPEPGKFRLLIREYEYLSANYVLADEQAVLRQPRRLVYAEAIDLDAVLVTSPAEGRGTTV